MSHKESVETVANVLESSGVGGEVAEVAALGQVADEAVAVATDTPAVPAAPT